MFLLACIGCQRHVMGGGACARSLFKGRGSAHSFITTMIHKLKANRKFFFFFEMVQKFLVSKKY
jgi:hypothetical protein